MKTNIIAFFAICFAASFAAAQPVQPIMTPPEPIMSPQSPLMTPGRSIGQGGTPVVYKDSVEFNKYFKELYAIIGPKKSVKEDGKEYLSRLSRSFAMQGIDTAKADSMALIGLDADAYRKIYFDAYRRSLTAAELKKYVEFIKTPEGKKVVEMLPQLERVNAETNSYVARLINTNIAPLRQEAFQRMQKEHPPTQRSKQPRPQGPDGSQPMMVPGQPGGLMQPQQMVPPTPAPTDSSAKPHH